jgi:hypothetical protein
VKATSHRVRRNDYTPPCVQLVLRSHYQQHNGRTDLKVRQIPPSLFLPLCPRCKGKHLLHIINQPYTTWSTMHACMLSGRRPRDASERAARTSRCLFPSVSSVCLSLSVMSRLASPSFVARPLHCLASCMACPYALEFRANASVPIHRTQTYVITAVDFTPQINNSRSRTTGVGTTEQTRAHQHYIYRAEKEAQC